MNAPFLHSGIRVRLARVSAEAGRIEALLADHPQATPFHGTDWLLAVEAATGHRALALVAERGTAIAGYLPLSEVHSALFGRMLASTGFAVGGGVLVAPGIDPAPLFRAAEELALRRSCPAIELRGGDLPQGAGWAHRRESHAGFAAQLAQDDEAQLKAVPRKQRAEVRKGLGQPLQVTVGRASPSGRRITRSMPRASAISGRRCFQQACSRRCWTASASGPIS